MALAVFIACCVVGAVVALCLLAMFVGALLDGDPGAWDLVWLLVIIGFCAAVAWSATEVFG